MVYGATTCNLASVLPNAGQHTQLLACAQQFVLAAESQMETSPHK